MDQDLNRLLFELLGTLSEATKKITEILCRESVKGSGSGQQQSDHQTGETRIVEAVTAKVEAVPNMMV